jgi:transcriptional regulator of acetoin/glycerol metabolism
MAQGNLAYSNDLQGIQNIIKIFPPDLSQNELNLDSLSKRERTHLKESIFQLFINCCCADRELCMRKVLRQTEKALIIKSLTRFNGSIGGAAEALGVKYTTLYEKLKRHQIQFEKRPI